MSNVLYFAYGSNTNRVDWQKWCKDHGCSPEVLRPVGVAYLPDHDLAFSRHSDSRKGGVLDVVTRKGQLVHGVLFEVEGDGREAMDLKEGAPTCYEPFESVALTPEGRSIPVRTYRVPLEKKERYVKPSAAYVKIVAKGMRDFDLPCDMLHAAAEDKRTAFVVPHLFVYGTLLRGESRAGVIAAAKPTCCLLATTFGMLLDIGSYPGMVVAGNDLASIVRGEYVGFDDISEVLAGLDEIEGFHGFGESASLFRRAIIDVDMNDGHIRRAWTYLYASPESNPYRIESGSWRIHRGTHTSFMNDLIGAHGVALEEGMDINAIPERKLGMKSGKWAAMV